MHSCICEKGNWKVTSRFKLGIKNQLPCYILPVAVNVRVEPHCYIQALENIIESTVEVQLICFQTQRRCSLQTSH